MSITAEAFEVGPDTIEEFLSQLSGSHNCVFFNPDRGRGPVDAMTIPDSQVSSVSSRLAGLGDVNAYYMVNQPKAGSPHKKLTKENVSRIRAVWADLDPQVDIGLDRARELILEKALEVRPKPTTIIDSGGGYQLLWFLKEPVPVSFEIIVKAEAIGEEIAFRLGGDAVYNIDRIMRLPFTENIPDASKLKKGRVRRPTQIADWTGIRYTLDELSGFFPTTPDRPAKGDKVKDEDIAAVHIDVAAASSVETYDHLPGELRGQLEDLRRDETFATLWEGKKLKGDTSGSGMLASLVFHLRRAEFDPTEIAMIARVWQPCWGSSRAKNTAPRALKRVIAKADLWVKEKQAAKSLPTVRLVPNVSEVAAKVERAIFKSGIEIYRRDFLLVRPVIALSRDNKTITGKFMEITSPYMRDLMARSINFERWDARSKKYVQVPPPKDIAEIILSRVGHWPFHQVNGIIMCQSMRPDGTLILKEGFDEATGLYLLDPPPMSDIPDKPTQKEALASLKILEDLIQEFNFMGESNKSIALSALMTSVARCAIDLAPMHALTAPIIGSGKTYFVNCCAMIATGRRAPAFSAGQSEEELEKRVSSAYLDGSPIILIDNVARDLESNFLCIAVEQTRFKIRMLGRSKAPEVEPCCVVFTTGNNLVIVGDLVRRTVLAELDPKEEKPWLRSFDQHPLQMIGADRGKYIAAVLTICRAFKQSGAEVVSPKLESFEQWSDLIASALVWLGKENPVNSIEVLFENDPERESPLQVIKAWEKIPALSGKVAVSEIIALASKWQEGGSFATSGWVHEELHHALVAVAGDGSRINPTKMGKWLGKHRNRLFDGRMIKRSEKRELHGVHAWWLAKNEKDKVGVDV